MLKTILASSSNQAQEDYLACIDLIKASPWVKEESFNLYYNAAKKTYSDEYEFNAENPGYDNISFLEAINKERKH